MILTPYMEPCSFIQIKIQLAAGIPLSGRDCVYLNSIQKKCGFHLCIANQILLNIRHLSVSQSNLKIDPFDFHFGYNNEC